MHFRVHNTGINDLPPGLPGIAVLKHVEQAFPSTDTPAVVVIKAPNKATTLTRVGGTETMILDSWTISGNPKRVVASQEPYSFKIGGTLHVNAGQVEGTYEGTFQVDVQYQ